MFTTLIVQPLFNLLALIYALIPGHNFGIALILFTVIIRLLMWPLLKRQARQTKLMRKLQPELKRIKKDAKGDKVKEQAMMMELYKERGFNPFGTLPLAVVQIIIILALYSGLRRVIHNPKEIYEFAYPALQHLSWLQHVHHNIHAFDNTLFGFIDLTRTALGAKGTYIPALILVIGSAGIQFLTARQIMPKSTDSRKLRDILKEAGSGKQADNTEVQAAVGRSTQYIIPFTVFIFTVNLAAALSLYWFVGGIVMYVQQSIALREDVEDMEKLADAKPKRDVSKIVEAEVVSAPVAKKTPRKKSAKRKKR